MATLGDEACPLLTFDMRVVPSEALHIELVSVTPGDPDEGAVAGSDLDLHFVHPLADQNAANPDAPWFDPVFDVHWNDEHPDWNSFSPGIDDGLDLDRDDTDGAGPENLNLNAPEPVCYGVGVHYWEDNDFGAATATVRVYVHGVLTYERSRVLDAHDLWHVADVCWPDAPTPVDNGPTSSWVPIRSTCTRAAATSCVRACATR